MRNVKHLMVLATSLFMLCACDKGNGNTDDPNKGDKPQVEVAAPVDPKPNSTSFDPTFPHQYITRLCFLVPGHP